MLDKAQEKKTIARKTAESYFNNKIQSYCDKINAFKLENDIENAKGELLEFYDLDQTSIFADYKSQKKLEEMALLLNMSVAEIEDYRREREAEQLARKQEQERRETAERKEKESDSWLSKKLVWDLECGSGHMLNTYLSYKLGPFLIGGGWSFTYDNEKVLGQTFKGYLYNFTGILNYNFVQNRFLWIDLRARAGYEWIKFDTWSEKGAFLSADLLIGHHNLYGTVAVPMFFHRLGIAVAMQMGLGLRARY